MIKVITWIGTTSSILGAFLVAFKVFFIGYVLFFIGATLWAIAAKIRVDYPLLVLQIVFLCANITGLINFY